LRQIFNNQKWLASQKVEKEWFYPFYGRNRVETFHKKITPIYWLSKQMMKRNGL